MSLDNFGLLSWYSLPLFLFLISTLAQNYKTVVNEGIFYYFRGNKYLIIIASLILILLAGTRTTIGDTNNYINIFLRVPDTLDELLLNIDWEGEWGFVFYNFLVKVVFGDNPQVFLFITSLITIGLIFCTFYKYSQHFELSSLIFILAGTYVTTLNGIRQSLVAAIFFYFFKLIPEKKYFKYFLLCYLLSTIHTSALILMPLIFIFNMKAWGKGTKALIGIGVAMYLFYPVTAQIFSLFIKDTVYSGYTLGIVTGSAGSANIIRVLVASVPIVLSYINRKKMYGIQYYNVFLHASILNFTFMLLASAASWIFARFCIYFSLFSIVLLCWSIEVSRNRKILYYGCILAYFIFYYYEIAVLL